MWRCVFHEEGGELQEKDAHWVLDSTMATAHLLMTCHMIITALTEEPKGLSGLIILLMNTLMMLSSLSLSGSGGPPSKASTFPSSKQDEKVGMMIYWRIWWMGRRSRECVNVSNSVYVVCGVKRIE